MFRFNIIRLYSVIVSGNFFLTIFFCTVFLFFLNKNTVAAPIATKTAEFVANNFLKHLNTSHTIRSIESVESTNQHVGYLIQLSPQGYILVAGDDIRVPVKGYSLSSSFHFLPVAYTTALLRELEVLPNAMMSKSAVAPEATNSPYWQYLMFTQTAKASKETYAPDTFLLETKWGRDIRTINSTPYPVAHERSPVACKRLSLNLCVTTGTQRQVMAFLLKPGMVKHTLQ